MQAAWRCPECSARPGPPLRYGTIGIVTSSELGLGPCESTPGWAARVTSSRLLILVAAALVLTNIPLTRYGSGGPPDYIGSSLGVLVTFWQLWGRRRLAWVVSTAATAAALPIYALSIAGVINYVLPGWWMLITGPADVLALATLLSSPIRRWVTMQPALMG
jgi:hypothetical protein